MLIEIIQKISESKPQGFPMLLMLSIQFTKNFRLPEHNSDGLDEDLGDNFPYLRMSVWDRDLLGRKQK